MPAGAAGYGAAMTHRTDRTDRTDKTGRTDSCEHDYQVVNHDENREILKCTKCGELERE